MSTTPRAVLIRAYGGANVAEVAEIKKPEAGPADIPAAIERNRTHSRTGKVVADFSR